MPDGRIIALAAIAAVLVGIVLGAATRQHGTEQTRVGATITGERALGEAGEPEEKIAAAKS